MRSRWKFHCSSLVLCAAAATAGWAVPLEAQAEKTGAPATAPAADSQVSAAEGAAPARGGTQRKQPETILEFAIAGGWMMLPLCVASVLWVGFFVERMIVLWPERVVPGQLLGTLRSLLDDRPFDRARALAAVKAHPSPAASVFRAALDRFDLSPQAIEKGVQNTAAHETYLLRDHLWIFAVISTVAPLLGLLGTVIGLVQAFREVAISGLGAGATLAPGIYEALVSTVAGLATAIPSLAIYYWLHARVDGFLHDIDGVVVRIVEAAELASVSSGEMSSRGVSAQEVRS